MKLKKVNFSQAKEIQFTNNTPGKYLMEFEKAIRWLRSKSLQVINAGEGVEKREPSYTVGGNAN